MNTVKTQQMRVCRNRAEVIDGNNFDVSAARLDDGTQHVATDATKSVDGYFDCHGTHSLTVRISVTANKTS